MMKKAMRIGIDARCLMEGNRTGVQEYTIEFLKKLLSQDPDNRYVLFFNAFKPAKEDISWLRAFNNVEIKNYGFPNKLLNLSMWLLGWPRVDVLLGGVDIFFAPNIAFLAVTKKCRLVLTIHDLSFERFPEYFSPKRRLWHFLLNPRLLCQRADKLLAVSGSTKHDLVELYGIDPSKIEIVAPFVDYEKFINSADESNKKRQSVENREFGENYLLFLGTIEPRKNIISIVKAFERIKERDKTNQSLKLVIAGPLGWSYGKIIESIEKSPWKDDIIRTGFVRDEEKPALYRSARIFIYPSFFEGYGFPPAEAMATGTPVITSHCSSLPEVVGDCGILIDPYRPFDIVLAVELLLGDKELYNEYARRGLSRSKEMSNENHKQNCLEILTNFR